MVRHQRPVDGVELPSGHRWLVATAMLRLLPEHGWICFHRMRSRCRCLYSRFKEVWWNSGFLCEYAGEIYPSWLGLERTPLTYSIVSRIVATIGLIWCYLIIINWWKETWCWWCRSLWKRLHRSFRQEWGWKYGGGLGLGWKQWQSTSIKLNSE